MKGKEKNKLSIFLIKKSCKYMSYAINKIEEVQENGGYKKIDENTIIVMKKSEKKPPSWASDFFGNSIDLENIFVANARVLVLKKVKVSEDEGFRIFALTFGYGRNLLNEDMIEDRFGLKVVLNNISHDGLRKVAKVDISGNQKSTQEQMPLKSEIADFGVDIHRDLIRGITGTSINESFVKGMLSGSDLLSINAKANYSTIEEFLIRTYNEYCNERYKELFGWIDNIQYVKSKTELEKLNNYLVQSLINNDDEFWMAVPEVIKWEDIKGFKYTKKGELFEDIDIERVLESMKNNLQTVCQLYTKQIFAISSKDDSLLYTWQAYKCIYGECLIDGSVYCINNGKWYKVNNSFVDQINEDYKQTKISSINFPVRTCEHDSENAYTKKFCEKSKSKYICMDASNISHGGGHSKIEVCDALGDDGAFVHIKPYSGSATLSHLFNQGEVSIYTLINDSTFLKKVNKLIEKSGGVNHKITNPHDSKVVYAIITKHKGDTHPHIPFFSKVAFFHIKKSFAAFRIPVEIKNIFDSRFESEVN